MTPGRSEAGAPRRRRRALAAAALAVVGIVVVAGGAGLLALREGAPAGSGATSTAGPAAASPAGGPPGPVETVPPTSAPAESPGDLLALPIESAPPRGPGLVARENARRGTDRWRLALDGSGDAEAYFDDVSVAPGDAVGLHLRATSPTVDVSLVRLGAYDGLGARLVGRWPGVPVAPQPTPCRIPRPG